MSPLRTGLLIFLIVISTCSRAASVGHGFLMGSVSESGAEGPKEGDIRLRDATGNWLIVKGISVNPAPYTKDSVTIAVIDSGVAADHPQLKGLIAEQRDFTGEGMNDRIGHGTVVTILLRSPVSQLSAQEQAQLPSPRIIEAKVANADGSIDKNALISAVQWVAQRGARVVNLSLGFREGTDDYSGVCDIISRNAEVLFVAAAGNFGPNVKVYPAACKADNLIPVAASDPSGRIAAYSGSGDVVAPGTAILVPMDSSP